MSTVVISDLHSSGSALFADSESYLQELNAASYIRGGGDANVLTIEQMPTRVIEPTELWSWCLTVPPKSCCDVPPKI